MTVEYTDTSSPRVIVRNAKGVRVGSISGIPPVSDIMWSADGKSFILQTYTSGDSRQVQRVYAYSAHDGKTRLIADKVYMTWENRGCYVLIEDQMNIPKAVQHDPRSFSRGSYIVLDKSRDFKCVANFGRLAQNLGWSPDSRRIVFYDTVKDEYGDYAKYALSIVDIPSGRVKQLVVTRRKSDCVWFGNDAVAAVTYDKYHVPTLSLYGIDGKVTKLMTTVEYATVKPLSTPIVPGSVVYQGLKSVGDAEGELWSVKPGGKPVRIVQSGHTGGNTR